MDTEKHMHNFYNYVLIFNIIKMDNVDFYKKLKTNILIHLMFDHFIVFQVRGIPLNFQPQI